MSSTATHVAPPKAGRRLGVLLALSVGAHLLALAHSPALIPFDSPNTVLNIHLTETSTVAATHTSSKTPTEITTLTNEKKRIAAKAAPPEPSHIEKKVVADTSKPTPTPAENFPVDALAPQPPAQKPVSQVKALLLARLRNSMNETFRYPLLARKRGWEGEVQLDIKVAANGNITGITIRQSSGHKLLDNSALETLARIGHIAEAISWLNGRSLNVTLPVIYRLTSN